MQNPYGNNIHVVGVAGTEGAAVLSFLSSKCPRKYFTAHDYSEKKFFLKNFKEAHIGIPREEALEKGKTLLSLENVEFHFQDEYLKGIEEADTIFVPQSWYLYEQNEPLKRYQDKFRSITRLYFDLFPGKIIGVTGSNGKTTTTNLIAKMMKEAFPQTLFSGNDRRTEQVLEEIEAASKEDWLVLEISNRQLKIDLGKSPDISVITNITPNHLTEHHDFADYAATKARLIGYQKKNQWSVLNADDPESKKLIEIDSGETMPFSTKTILPKGVFVEFGEIRIKHAERLESVVPVKDFPLAGTHNLSNALAATAAAYLAHVPLETIALVLRSAEPIPQRMELIRTVNNIEYYNDSASTAPQSTIAAIETLSQKGSTLVLIMGGKSKGLEYEALSQSIQNHVGKLVLLESPLSNEMQQLLAKKPLSMVSCSSLELALEAAKKDLRSGDRVLFSPAGEYFLYFRDRMPGYKNFRYLVERL